MISNIRRNRFFRSSLQNLPLFLFILYFPDHKFSLPVLPFLFGQWWRRCILPSISFPRFPRWYLIALSLSKPTLLRAIHSLRSPLVRRLVSRLSEWPSLIISFSLPALLLLVSLRPILIIPPLPGLIPCIELLWGTSITRARASSLVLIVIISLLLISSLVSLVIISPSIASSILTVLVPRLTWHRHLVRPVCS